MRSDSTEPQPAHPLSVVVFYEADLFVSRVLCARTIRMVAERAEVISISTPIISSSIRASRRGSCGYRPLSLPAYLEVGARTGVIAGHRSGQDRSGAMSLV